MGWSVVIAFIVRLMVPVLAEFLLIWLERHLKKATEGLPDFDVSKPYLPQFAKLFNNARRTAPGPFRRRLIAFVDQVVTNRVRVNVKTGGDQVDWTVGLFPSERREFSTLDLGAEETVNG